MIRGSGQIAVGSKLGCLLSGPLDTSAQGKMVTNMFHMSALPVQTLD